MKKKYLQPIYFSSKIQTVLNDLDIDNSINTTDQMI